MTLSLVKSIKLSKKIHSLSIKVTSKAKAKKEMIPKKDEYSDIFLKWNLCILVG